MFENVDGRRTPESLIGIPLAQPFAFGSGELKRCSKQYFKILWLLSKTNTD